MRWVCTACASRAAEPGTCCDEPRLDLEDERVRDLLRDIDLRAEQRRETRVRFFAVAIGVGAVLALWCVPGWWAARQIYGLPFFADQWLLMIALALGVVRLFGRPMKKFTFIDDTVA